MSYVFDEHFVDVISLLLSPSRLLVGTDRIVGLSSVLAILEHDRNQLQFRSWIAEGSGSSGMAWYRMDVLYCTVV